MMIAPVKDVDGNPDGQKVNPLSLSSFENQSIGGTFMIGANTYFSIGKQTTISVNTNLELRSPVMGEGKLVLGGDKKLSIDAKGNSITNLVVRNEGGVELLSQLNISDELTVEEGILYLNDFNLVLENSFVKLNQEARGGIAFNGSGRIISQTVQPLATHAPQQDRDMGSQAFIILQAEHNPILSGTQITYYIYQHFDAAVLCPPTPPPD